MELKYYPIWSRTNEAGEEYPKLKEDTQCDICVIGAGITGCLCALRLAERGEDVALITENAVGSGATSGAMPCAVYDMGTTLRSLSRQHGESSARTIFSVGASALDALERLCGTDCGFQRKDSLLFTDNESQVRVLAREYIDRRDAGFDCMYLNKSTAADILAFPVEGAIISKQLAACFDPLQLARLCAKRARGEGARIYENTRAVRILPIEDYFEIETSACRTITAKYVVVAATAACADAVEGLVHDRTCFMAATEPLEHRTGLPGECVVQCLSKPEINLAVSPDGRVCVKGLSSSVVDEKARFFGMIKIPALRDRRFSQLRQAAEYIFPAAVGATFEYFRASRGLRSVDDLPIIGALDEQPRCIFASCSGSGGVLMSEVASEIVSALICEGKHELAELFSPERRALIR